MNAVDPLAGEVGECREVVGRREPLGLEATHLARRGRRTLSRFATNDPAHRRIMAQTFGVVHVLVAGETPEQGLPKQPDQRMAAFLPVRASASTFPAIALRPRASSSSR